MTDDTSSAAHIIQGYLLLYQALDVPLSKAAELARETSNLRDSVTAAAKRLTFDQAPDSYSALLRRLGDGH